MDLIRKLSSGLRSSQELDSSVEKWVDADKGEYEENEEVVHDAEEDGDVFEDAGTGQQQQYQQEEERGDILRENGKTEGASPIRVRAPISVDTEEEYDKEDDFVEDDDGEASFGSGESFDSALERMMTSSTAGSDIASGHKVTYRAGSLTDRAVNGSSPPSPVTVGVSQEGKEDSEELLEQNHGQQNSQETPLKIRAALSNIEAGEELSYIDYPSEQAVSEESGYGTEEEVVQNVRVPVSQQSDDDSEDLQEENYGEESALDVPLKIRAALTDVDGINFPHTDYLEQKTLLEENGDYKDEPVLPQVRAPVSEQDDGGAEELSEESEEEEIVEDVPLKIRARAALSELPRTNQAGAEALSEEDGNDKDVLLKARRPAPLEYTSVETSPLINFAGDKTKSFDGTSGSIGSRYFKEELDETQARADSQPNEVEPESTAGDGEATDLGPHETKPRDLMNEMSAEAEVSAHEPRDSEAPGAEDISDKRLNEVADEATTIEKLDRLLSETKGQEEDENVPVDAVSDEAYTVDTDTAQEELFDVKSARVQSFEHRPVDSEARGSPEADGLSDGEELINKGKSNKLASQTKEEGGEKALGDADGREDFDDEGNSDEESDEEDEGDDDAFIERSSILAGEADSPSLGAAGPSLPARPTRNGRSPVPSRVMQQPRGSGAGRTQLARSADNSPTNEETLDGNDETREKLQAIRVKFLRLALRLGQSPHNVVVAQVLYRLGLAEQLRGGRSNIRNATFSFDRASAIAEEQEAAGPKELDFTCTIMLLGKSGVGKSATINSIFGEPKTETDAFSPSTRKVQVITGLVHGIKVRVIDTPGLLPSVADQRRNEKVMASVKGFIQKQAPDIVLYFDRLDMQSRDYGDLPLLRTITDTFGAAVWFNAIVVLTHASSAPPDGANGLPLSYEMFVAQRSHVVQQTIRQAAGDMRLMNPVSLVENHRACRVNRAGEMVLPNGQIWKPLLLLLCFASKILAEANTLLKLQDSTPGRPFGARPRVPPLPFLLSSLLQSRAQLRLPDEQMGEEDESEEEFEEDEDSDEEEDYDQLPPFRRLTKEEVAELDEENRRNYFEELAERERLFKKKQWREELNRRRELRKRMQEAARNESQSVDEGLEDDMARSASVPVPMPDMVLPPSFDSDNPGHRYRCLETANQWIVRPVLESHGWDHDCGYDGMSLEKMFVIRDNIPAAVSGQITKDKKEASVNMECAASLKHGEGKITLAGLDFQTVGKDLAYTLRSETRFSNFKGNKTTGGLSLTLLGDTVSAGMKIEDRLFVGKRLKLVVNGGAITGRGDVAYGGSLEATLRDNDFPLSRTLSTLGLSIMDWHGDLAIGGNLQSQFALGKTMMVGRANINNRGAGQISIRASSSEQLQMTLIGLLPVIRSIANRLFGSQWQQ